MPKSATKRPAGGITPLAKKINQFRLQVPTNIEAVAAAIEVMRNTDPARMFQEAQMELDKVVADLFGMSQGDLDYITSAMMNDGFLKQLRPNYEHRGLRVQPYADHSQEDRYA